VAFPAYSTRLCTLILPVATWTTCFTAPAGYRNVVTFYAVTQGYASGNLLRLQLSTGPAVELLRVPPPVNASGYFGEVRIVVHEGETLLARLDVSAGTLHLGGYLLQGSGGPDQPAQKPLPDPGPPLPTPA
jgi:hypothetical protein